MSQTKTLNWVEKLARQVVLLSRDDNVVAVDEGRVLLLTKGQYGGWLLREKDAPETLQGLWCYKTVKRRAAQKDLEAIKDIVERLKKVAESVGVRTEPRILKIVYKYRVVTAKKEKSTERYSVYEISATNEEAAAVAVKIEYPYKIGKNGRCANDVCRHYGKLKKLIEAEFRGGDVHVSGVDVTLLLDVSEVVNAIRRLIGIDEAEAEAEGGSGGVEGAEEAENGGGAKRYLVALLPGGVDEEVAIDAVREALKKLGVKDPVVKVVEAEV
jgi:hypothetical protein